MCRSVCQRGAPWHHQVLPLRKVFWAAVVTTRIWRHGEVGDCAGELVGEIGFGF